MSLKLGLRNKIRRSRAGGFTPLLDQSFASNATAAYSLRQLKSSATKAVRVRESSANTETDIGFSGATLDTTALLNHVGSANGFVTKWYDQSGNGNDASNSTASEQPQIVDNGSVIKENNKPALKLSGNQYFDTNVGFSGNKTCYIVINPDFNATSFAGIIGSDTSVTRILLQNKDDYLYQFYGSTHAIEQKDQGYKGGVQSLITVTKNHTVATNQIFIDGSEVNYKQRNTTTDVTANLQLFTRDSNVESMVGTGQEIIIFGDDDLSERTGTESDMDNFYNIPNF